LQSKLEGVGTCFMIRLYKRSASFLWSFDSIFRGSNPDLKVKVEPRELIALAKNLGYTVSWGRIILPDLDAYNRLLLYAAVRPTIRSHLKAAELAMLIRGLTDWDAHYWASRLRELWWEHRSYRSLLKAVKAFKLFFGLD